MHTHNQSLPAFAHHCSLAVYLSCLLLSLPPSLPPCTARLIRLLDIDLNWRLNKVSDGQRRRVQIAMGLLKPYQVCALQRMHSGMLRRLGNTPLRGPHHPNAHTHIPPPPQPADPSGVPHCLPSPTPSLETSFLHFTTGFPVGS
jgi:hypothetical protein